MQTKRNKVTRKRGSETHGHGSSKKWRGKGHHGGHGKAGSGKRGDAKIMKVTKGNKKYLGKYGFTSMAAVDKTINLETIERSVITLLAEKKIKKEKEFYEIDLVALGYDKLLSKGIVKNKYRISVPKATPNAIKRVEEAGGQVTILAAVTAGEE